MGKFNKVISIVAGVILGILFLLCFMIPFAFGPILLGFISLIVVAMYLLKERSSLSHRSELKTFYCPFSKKIVRATFRPSLFTYRTYDDVMKCSVFKSKVRCKKKCLEIPQLKYDTQHSALAKV